MRVLRAGWKGCVRNWGWNGLDERMMLIEDETDIASKYVYAVSNTKNFAGMCVPTAEEG